jgi:hypothetical protein
LVAFGLVIRYYLEIHLVKILNSIQDTKVA